MLPAELASLFFSTLLALALVLFLAWFFLSRIGRVSQTGGGQRRILVLDRLAVDRDKVLLLVAVGERTFLLAMSAGAVNTVCEFTPQQVAAWQQAAPTEGQSFSAMLTQLRRRGANTQDEGENPQ